jgi:Holliday junction resolvase RusA-like endonuclease
MTQSDKWQRRVCTTRYWQFKDELKALWGEGDLPAAIGLVFIMPMPAGWSEKKKSLMDGKPHQVKPDGDNLLKAFQDCLAESDSYIWDVRFTKVWGRSGSIHVYQLEPFMIKMC